MSVVVVGLNHRTVPLDVLERMTVDDARMPKALHDLCTRPNLNEAVVLSTCNRTEIYTVAERYHGAIDDVRTFLTDLSGLNLDAFSDHLYAYHDETAVAHLFKVVSGLDSAVVGETEILGQVRGAWERAEEEGAAATVMRRLFRQALDVGKRARTETAIARGTTSVSQAAVAMAVERLGSLDGRKILVLGSGAMGEGMAVALAGAASSAEILVVNRTRAKAVTLASRVGGRAIQYGDLGTALLEVDLLLTSTGATSTVIDSSDLQAVMAARPTNPLLIVDVAVPRDVEPAAAEVDGVTLLDMDDLRAFAAAGIAGRRREIAGVQLIVEEEVERYLLEASARQLVPIVSSLRDKAELVRKRELERFRARLADLEPKEREAVEALTHGIVNKILHEPTVRLKDAAGSARADRLGDALRALFDL
ncbi:MAG: Glutamyl-tRNA reductase [uncultured Acidimicrobiales bacterium]|uniref:Glutamyl-tRNA reductase n=1 Tax=uncultured Acidimicrobiales bacterium TaxID=310071 RepID=A0A6J4HSR0_9ACTN|nr:MAG: Glutamyl-tRNA reductase [uncultured Acidimicrobiales bacterium]